MNKQIDIEAILIERNRYKEALERISRCQKDSGRWSREIAIEALNLQPQYEEVELSAFINVKTGDVYRGEKYRPSNVSIDDILKLTGTYQRPIKPKVKRREEVEVIGFDYNGKALLAPTPTHTSYDKFYIEWEE